MKRLVSMKLLTMIALVTLTVAAVDASPHDDEIRKWREERVARLRSETGWLTLVGLQWLKPGENRIENPAGGTVVLKGGAVTLAPHAGYRIGGQPVTAPVRLLDDTDPKGPTVVDSGTVHFNVIRRNDQYGLRVKDSNAKARTHFRGIDSFPISAKWRVDARFEPFNPPKKVPITNILGMTSEETAPGLLAFTVDGRQYKVEPILEEGSSDWFIIFKDKTSGKETYGAARFVYAAPPDKNGHTVIDFNKAYNPPCAFTPFATCPLPPPQNRFTIRVDAGEKKYAGGHE